MFRRKHKPHSNKGRWKHSTVLVRWQRWHWTSKHSGKISRVSSVLSTREIKLLRIDADFDWNQYVNNRTYTLLFVKYWRSHYKWARCEMIFTCLAYSVEVLETTQNTWTLCDVICGDRHNHCCHRESKMSVVSRQVRDIHRASVLTTFIYYYHYVVGFVDAKNWSFAFIQVLQSLIFSRSISDWVDTVYTSNKLQNSALWWARMWKIRVLEYVTVWNQC